MSIDKVLLVIDKIGHIIPVVSTALGLAHLFAKYTCLNKAEVGKSRLYAYVKNEPDWVSILISIPIAGNIGYLIFIFVKKCTSGKKSDAIGVKSEPIPFFEKKIKEEEKVYVLSENFKSLFLGEKSLLERDQDNRYRFDADLLEELFNVDAQAEKQQEEAVKKLAENRWSLYKILRNIYQLKLSDSEIYIIENSSLSKNPQYVNAAQEKGKEIKKQREEKEKQRVGLLEEKESLKQTLRSCLEAEQLLFEKGYLYNLTTEELDKLYQMHIFLNEEQSLFSDSEIQEMKSLIEKSKNKWLYEQLINIRSGKVGKNERILCDYLKSLDLKVLSKKGMDEHQKKWEKLNAEKKQAEEEKNEKRVQEIEKMMVESLQEVKNSNRKLLKTDWLKKEEKIEGSLDSEKLPYRAKAAVLEMRTTEEAYLNKLKKMLLFLDRIQECNTELNQSILLIKKSVEKLIRYSADLVEICALEEPWSVVLKGLHPNRMRDLFVVFCEFQESANELMKQSVSCDEREELKEVISSFVREQGVEECRKIGMTSVDTFSGVMQNFLIAPIQRALRYRLLLNEFSSAVNKDENCKQCPQALEAVNERLQALMQLGAILNLLQ